MKETIISDTVKGTLGIAATGGSIAVSRLGELETMLRITSLCIGIIVGLATLVSLIISIHWKLKNQKKVRK